MNIWILNHYATSPNSVGISRHYDLSKYLARNGHNVTIFASSFNHQTREEEHIKENKVYKKSKYNDVNFVWIKTSPYKKNDFHRVKNILDYSKRLFLLLKKYPEKPDIIIGSLMHPIAPMIANYFSKKWGVPFYFEERDLWPQSLIDLGKVSQKNPIVTALSILENKFYKDSKRIIFLFDKAHHYALQKNVSEEKLIYLPNGVDLQRIEKNKGLQLPNELMKYFENNEEKIIGIYAGAHSLANDLDSLIEAIKNVKDDRYAFLFIGDGPDKQKAINLAEEYNLKNISFYDAIPKDVLHAVLSKCHFGMIKFKNLPVYRWGVSPNKIYDYMGSELPVIMGLNQDDHPIEYTNSGIVIKEHFELEFSDILKNLNKKDFENMANNAYNLANEEYSWENLSEKLEKIIVQDSQGE